MVLNDAQRARLHVQRRELARRVEPRGRALAQEREVGEGGVGGAQLPRGRAHEACRLLRARIDPADYRNSVRLAQGICQGQCTLAAAAAAAAAARRGHGGRHVLAAK